MSVAVSSDGKTLAASFRNVDLGLPNERGNIVLWDADKGDELRRLSISEGEASNLALHPDGKTLALIAARERTLHLWDCSTGKPLPRTIEPNGKVETLAFSPDGKLLVFTRIQGERKSLCFWETDPWREQRRVDLRSRHPLGVFDGLAFTPDSKLLAVTELNSVRFVDPATGTPGDLLEQAGALQSLGFSADGKVLAVAAINPTTGLTLWDVATRQRLHAVRAQGMGTRALACSSSRVGRSLLATGGNDATVRLWDPATGTQQNIVASHGAAVHTVALLSDDRAVTVSRDENTFRLWKASTGEELNKGSLGEHLLANVLAAPGAKLLAVTRMPTIIPQPFQKLPISFEKEIHLIDFSGKEVNTLKSEESTLALAITPDGRTLAATEGPKRIAIWDVPAGKVVRRIELDQEVYGLFMPPPAALSADGKSLGLRLATMTPAGVPLERSFSVWDVTTGKQRWRMETRYESDSLAFSPDGKLFADAAQGIITLCDSATGKQLREFDCSLPGDVWSRGETERIAFTPDGKTLIAGGCGPQVFLWDLATGAERGRLVSHRGRVFSVSVSPDGKQFATAGADTTGMVWELPER
jgi:WD40 repeat protein